MNLGTRVGDLGLTNERESVLKQYGHFAARQSRPALLITLIPSATCDLKFELARADMF